MGLTTARECSPGWRLPLTVVSATVKEDMRMVPVALPLFLVTTKEEIVTETLIVLAP